MDFRHMMSEFKSDIQTLVTRKEHIETKMADFGTSHSLLILIVIRGGSPEAGLKYLA